LNQMVNFRDYTSPSSKLKYLIIESTKNSVETKLLVHTPFTGWYAGPWPPLRNTLHMTNWTSERKPTTTRSSKMWSLQAPHHCYTNIANPLPSLGHRIVRGDISWGETVVFEGEYYHIPGYWEWDEDTLGRSQEVLVTADIYDAIYASFFTYNRNSDILQAFCEAWCPKTNTILTSLGELSISLWDLHTLGGLPIRGSFYEEVIPQATELTCVDAKDQRCIPQVCEYLFTTFHYLQESKTDNSRVFLSRWIGFWYKKSLRYEPAPPRREKKTAPLKFMHNPTGAIPEHLNGQEARKGYFQILVDAAGPISTKISEVAPQGCSNATPKTGDSSASMGGKDSFPLSIVAHDSKKKRSSRGESTSSHEDHCWKKVRSSNKSGDADLAVLEISDSVDSPSRTLTIPFKESNCVGSLPRGGSRETGESVSGLNPIKSYSAGKTGKEATSIRRDGVRARLSSDLQKHPTATVSVFDGKKLSGSDVDYASYLKEEVQVILEEMDDKDVDVSPLIRLMKSFFELAAIYDQARSTLHDKDNEVARKELSIAAGERLSNAMFEEREKIKKVSSICKSLSEIDVSSEIVKIVSECVSGKPLIEMLKWNIWPAPLYILRWRLSSEALRSVSFASVAKGAKPVVCSNSIRRIYTLV
ncbi:hypothetical protein HAX54_049544, partial [Datura stramonium]|nr:hypothetical protein [Datura stramonium]